MQFPYFLEVSLKRYHPELKPDHAATPLQFSYVELGRILRKSPEMAPTRARSRRAGP